MSNSTWDGTVKISGADQDFHRRDMLDATAADNFPEWEFAMQLFTQERVRLHFKMDYKQVAENFFQKMAFPQSR